MQPKKKSSPPKLSQPIDSVNRKDKRANIPTEELRDFIADEEKAPKTVRNYQLMLFGDFNGLTFEDRGLLSPRTELVEPHDFGGFVDGDDFTC
jgi:hypothetical protein